MGLSDLTATFWPVSLDGRIFFGNTLWPGGQRELEEWRVTVGRGTDHFGSVVV